MRSILLTAVMLCSLAHAEVAVFGLPLGGTLPSKMARCASETSKATSVCWMRKPSISRDGSRSGNIAIPDSALPQWADYGTASLLLDKAGEIQEIGVSGVSLDQQDSIVQSISRRFGEHAQRTVIDAGSITHWKRPGIRVEMICVRSGECTVTFRSESYAEVVQGRSDASQRQQAARPANP
jgi:hypothetical protein